MGFSSMSYSTTQTSSLNLNTNGNLYVQSNDYEGFEKEGKYKSVDELDLSVDDSKYDYASLTEEDIASLVGKMSKQEYDEFINGMVNYYAYEKDYLNKMLDEVQPIITDLDDRLLFTKDSYLQEMANYRNAIQSAWFGNPNLENSGTTYDEFMAMTYDEKLEFADGKSDELKKVVEAQMDYENSFNESVKLEYGKELGVSTMEELIKVQEELHAYAQEIQTSIDMINHNMDSAKYDYIYFLKNFDDFSYKTSFTEEELATFQTEINGTYSRQATGAYSYNDYVQLHPEVSQLEFVRMVKQVDPNAMIADVDNSVELNNLVRASEVVPQLGKTYAYLYSISPDDAAQYLKDVEYEINQINGQLDAEAFLETLYEKDGDYDNLEIVANELGVTTEGLLDGLGTFFSGVGYSFEALLTAVGLTEENRTLSSEEYKKMYILQALMPQDVKEEMGLIKYNNYDANGFKTSVGAENADPNSVIDYTKDYSGFLLDANYEISQGIGNMAPSILLSAYNPILGSVAMGDSAGGNAYHNAMVEGHSYLASVAYGVFTGTSEALTERLFGGLPGLSDVEVTGVGSYLKAAGREGFQESFQEIMDISYRVNVMGEEMPSDEELLKQIGKSGVYGAITAGILQSPSLINGIKTNHANTQSVDTNTNVSDVTGTDTDTQVSNPLEQTEVNNTTTTETNQNTVTDVVEDATVVAAVPTSTNTDTNVVTDVVEDVQVSNNTSITENVADNSFNESVVEDVQVNETESLEATEDTQFREEAITETETTEANIEKALSEKIEALNNDVSVENLSEALDTAKQLNLSELDPSTKDTIANAFDAMSSADQSALIEQMDVYAAETLVACLPSIEKSNIAELVFIAKGEELGYSDELLQRYRNTLQDEAISWEVNNKMEKISDEQKAKMTSEDYELYKEAMDIRNSKMASEVTSDHLIAATKSLAQIKEKMADGYYVEIDPVTGEALTLDQVVQYKIDGKTKQKVNGRWEIINPVKPKAYEGIQHSEYLPAADCFISDDRVLAWTKEVCPDARVQAATDLQDLANILYQAEQEGNPITATFITFQNAEVGAKNIVKFNSYGHDSISLGGPFCIPEEQLIKFTEEYPDYCCFINGEFKILDMDNFGKVVLGGVPLGNAGAYMITTEVPINNANIGVPSANNDTAYVDFFVPGGKLLDGGSEATQRPSSCEVTGKRVDATGYDKGTFKGDTEAGVITDIEYEIVTLKEENSSSAYSRMAEQLRVSENTGVALDTEVKTKIDTQVAEWKVKINDPTLSDTAVLEIAATTCEIMNRMNLSETDALKVAKVYAEGMDAASTKYVGFFKNFREHAGEHSLNVAEYATKIAKANPNVDQKTVMYAAICHDLGMKGGYYYTEDANGNPKFEKIDGLYDINNLTADQSFDLAMKARKNHPLNSALIILTTDVVPADVDADVVALLAMSHSKSTSGIKHFSTKEEYIKCINKLDLAVQTYNKDNGTNYTFDTEKLIKMVNDPKQFEILQDAALAIRDGDAMSKVAYDAHGNIIMQNGSVNDVKVTKHRIDYNQKVESSITQELKVEGVTDTAINEDGVKVQLDVNNDSDAISMGIHVGEKNVLFDSNYIKGSGTAEGQSVYIAVAKPIDANLCPNCTFTAIEERLGEVNTYDNCDRREFVIKLPKEAQGTEIGKFYEEKLIEFKSEKFDEATAAKDAAKEAGEDISVHVTAMQYYVGGGTTGNIRIVYE